MQLRWLYKNSYTLSDILTPNACEPTDEKFSTEIPHKRAHLFRPDWNQENGIHTGISHQFPKAKSD